jgi:deazaflavin-dependent oxidoreductase (nitroreductase family)
MANWSWFTKLHRAVYRKTGGKIGGSLVGIPMCLLTTTGRKTGLSRTLPLACMRDGDNLVVVGSNNGQDHDPAWWRNLVAQPAARVEFGGDAYPVMASLATPEERARLWPLLEQGNPAYRRYKKKTQRPIPVVILRPTR